VEAERERGVDRELLTWEERRISWCEESGIRERMEREQGEDQAGGAWIGKEWWT
jgi:hypothetical protein